MRPLQIKRRGVVFPGRPKGFASRKTSPAQFEFALLEGHGEAAQNGPLQALLMLVFQSKPNPTPLKKSPGVDITPGLALALYYTEEHEGPDGSPSTPRPRPSPRIPRDRCRRNRSRGTLVSTNIVFRCS